MYAKRQDRVGENSFGKCSNNDKSVSSRIIWCYGQWQPLYFDMVRTMPGIEFNEGIPKGVDKPDYLDVSQRNLIVLDDLMAQSGKEKSIADLFTRGIHHRNLSVIYIGQNIFHQISNIFPLTPLLKPLFRKHHPHLWKWRNSMNLQM